MRAVTVPFKVACLGRFNSRFEVYKNWDGTFTSRLGWGYCTSGWRCEKLVMFYHFTEQATRPEKLPNLGV